MDKNEIYKKAYELVKRELASWGTDADGKEFSCFIDGIIAMCDELLEDD